MTDERLTDEQKVWKVWPEAYCYDGWNEDEVHAYAIYDGNAQFDRRISEWHEEETEAWHDAASRLAAEEHP